MAGGAPVQRHALAQRRCRQSGLAAGRVALLAAALLGAAPASHGAEEEGYSRANRLLFFSDHLQGLSPGSTLIYVFRKLQPEQAGFTDRVGLHLSAPEQGEGLNVRFEYLSGTRSKYVPPVSNATGNPILLLFLQHDAYEMSTRSGGSVRHFQNLIKQALQETAQVDAVRVEAEPGRTIAATRIRITPFLRDRYRARYPDLAGKSYEFTLSQAVPGGVYELRTIVPAAPDGERGPTDRVWEDIRFTRFEAPR